MERIRIKRNALPDLAFSGLRLATVCGQEFGKCGRARLAVSLFRTVVDAYVLAVEAQGPGRPEHDIAAAVAFAKASDIHGFLRSEGTWLRDLVEALLAQAALLDEGVRLALGQEAARLKPAA